MAEKDQAVSFLALQHLCVTLFAFFLVLRIADENVVALALGGVFDAFENQREEWVRDVRNRHDQLAGSQRPQRF